MPSGRVRAAAAGPPPALFAASSRFQHVAPPAAGLFEWSMQQQGDGTTSEARPLAEADRHWLEDALKSAMVDLGRRMQDITASLDAGTGGAAGGTAAAGSDEAAAAAALQAEEGASLEQKEQLLDELQDLIESIDLAKGEWLGGAMGRGACVPLPALPCTCTRENPGATPHKKGLPPAAKLAAHRSSCLNNPCHPLPGCRPAHHWRAPHAAGPAGQPAPLAALAGR